MDFTFYGDLLGIAGLYRLSPTLARDKLNDFYNTTFYSLESEWEEKNNVTVMMFSDSLLITGANPEAALDQLHRVYVKLLHKGLLLRGAMVAGKLEFEPRITRTTFAKMLPSDDTLARAVGLENTQKGARLLIENSLAEALLATQPDWLTQDGYVLNVQGSGTVPPESVLRRICPTPDGRAYEFLYFWVCSPSLSHHSIDYRRKRDELNEIRQMVRDDIGGHYRDTVGLLGRCEKRQLFTVKYVDGKAAIEP